MLLQFLVVSLLVLIWAKLLAKTEKVQLRVFTFRANTQKRSFDILCCTSG